MYLKFFSIPHCVIKAYGASVARNLSILRTKFILISQPYQRHLCTTMTSLADSKTAPLPQSGLHPSKFKVVRFE